MHAAGKIFVKTYLKAIRDTFFANMSIFPICVISIQQKGKVSTFRLAGRSPSSVPSLSSPPQFPCFVGYPDLPMRKTLRVVGLLIVMIFFQSNRFTACKIKDGKEKIIFYFLMVFNLLKIMHLFENKKHLRT